MAKTTRGSGITRHQREMIKLLERTGMDETEAKRQLQEAGLIDKKNEESEDG